MLPTKPTRNVSLATKLLADIKTVFTSQRVTFLPSAELVAALRRIEECTVGRLRVTARKLAYRLKEFGVKPGRDEQDTVRGYTLESLLTLSRGTSVRIRQYPSQRRSTRKNVRTDRKALTDRSVRTKTSVHTKPQVRCRC